MIGLALSAFFIVSGLFACVALALTWRAYGAAILAIRSQLREMDDRSVLIERGDVAVRSPRAGIRVRAVVRQPSLRPALRVAA